MVKQFVVGIVRGSHGVKGEFKVQSTSGEYEHFYRMEEVTLTDGNVSKVLKVESVRHGSDTLYLKLSGINTPEVAAEYNGWKIVVPREYAHKLQENEWYIEDLKGCSVFYKDDTADKTAPAAEIVVGTVTNVLEGGAGDLVEIKLSESCTLLDESVRLNKKGQGKTVYVPFKDQFIGMVDVEARKMQLMHLWILE